MKCLIVLTVLACAVHFSKALMSREEKMEMFKARITDCAAKEGASSADVDGIMTEQEPAGGFTREGICIAACMGEVSGMVKNNKIDPDALMTMTKAMYGDDTSKLDLAREMSTTCADVTDGDRCDAAFAIVKCIKKVAVDKGYTRENW